MNKKIRSQNFLLLFSGIVFISFFSLNLFAPRAGGASAEESTKTIKEAVKEAIKKWSPNFIDPLSKDDTKAINDAVAPWDLTTSPSYDAPMRFSFNSPVFFQLMKTDFTFIKSS